MSFINFESGTEKEKIRNELREAREKLLEKVIFKLFACREMIIVIQYFSRQNSTRIAGQNGRPRTS